MYVLAIFIRTVLLGLGVNPLDLIVDHCSKDLETLDIQQLQSHSLSFCQVSKLIKGQAMGHIIQINI